MSSSSASSPVGHDDKSIFRLVALGCFSSMASMRLCDTLLPQFSASFHVGTAQAAGTISLFAIAYGLMQLVYGPLGDRHGKLRVISLAIAFSALINLALVFAPSISMLIGLRTLAGAAAAGIIPLSLAYVGDTVSYENRQEVLARLLSACILGMIFGQWIGGLFADFLNWQSAFVLMALLFGITAVLMLRRLPPKPAPSSGSQSYFKQVGGIVRQPWPRRILLAAAIETAATYGVFVFIPAYVHQHHGLPLIAAGSVVVAFGAGGLLYTLLTRRLLSHLGERGMVTGGGLLLALGFGMLIVGPHWAWAVLGCLVAGLGFYAMHNTLQTLATQMAPTQRGTAVALFACCIFFGQSIGISANAAYIEHVGFQQAFVPGLVVLPLLGWWLAGAIKRHARPAA